MRNEPSDVWVAVLFVALVILMSVIHYGRAKGWWLKRDDNDPDEGSPCGWP